MKVRGTTITTPMSRSVVTDDAAVSTKPWSSKNTVDKLCPAFTKTGSIVTCAPFEGYPLEVVSHGGWTEVAKLSIKAVDPSEVQYTAEAGVIYKLDIDSDSEIYGVYVTTAGGQTIIATSTEINDLTASIVFTTPEDLREDIVIRVSNGVQPTVCTIYKLAPATKITRTGKNLLKPYIRTFTTNGLTFDVYEDGTVVINGTALGSSPTNFVFTDPKAGTYIREGVTYTLSGSTGGSSNTFQIRTYLPNSKELDMYNTNSPVTKVATGSGFATTAIYVSAGYTASNLVIKPQLEVGSSATPHEPYQEPEEFAPNETIAAWSGVNTLWADVGEITVTGRTVINNDSAQDVVLYTPQSLSDSQKAQARANIGAAEIGSGGGYSEGAVLYTKQTLTDEQKAQARLNIGAVDSGVLSSILTTKNLLTGTELVDGWMYASPPGAANANYKYYKDVFLPAGEYSTFGRVRFVWNQTTGKQIVNNSSSAHNITFTVDTDSICNITFVVYDTDPKVFSSEYTADEVESVGEYSLNIPTTEEPLYDYKNMLTGKKWYACGDSFTAGVSGGGTLTEGLYAGKNKVYPFCIGNRCGIDVTNLAVGGQTMTFVEGLNNCFSDGIYQNIGADADYITLKFGINDDRYHNNAPIGTIDDTTNTTFYGAWNIVMEYLITNHPTAHIGIIVTNGCTSEYAEATIAVAKKWGIPYLNMATGEQVSLPIRSNRTDVCNTATNVRLNTFKVSETDLHPNGIAHEYESRYIETWLMTI